MKPVILVFVLAACADSAPPPMPTWGDAWVQFLTPWCDNTARCNPEYFASKWSDRKTCVADRLQEVCLSSAPDCDTPYPADHIADLELCAAEVESLYCGALLPPDACFDAFAP